MSELDNRWPEGLRIGILRIPRCVHCGVWNWYPLVACRACGSSAFDWCEVTPQGTLHSWTRVHHRFTSHAIATPYLVGLVEPDETDGVRIPCRLWIAGGDPEIGAKGTLRAVTDVEPHHWQFRV